MTSKTFTCYKCKNTYEKGWSDQEASFEACVNFSEELEKGHDFDVVCDDCYNDFKKWMLKKHERELVEIVDHLTINSRH